MWWLCDRCAVPLDWHGFGREDGLQEMEMPHGRQGVVQGGRRLVAVPVAADVGQFGEGLAAADLGEEMGGVVGHLGKGEGGAVVGERRNQVVLRAEWL